MTPRENLILVIGMFLGALTIIFAALIKPYVLRFLYRMRNKHAK